MNHLTQRWGTLTKTAGIQVFPSSPLPYDRYHVTERIAVVEGSGYHPDADIEKAREKQAASYEKWRAANPRRPRPDRYRPENAEQWVGGGMHYFTEANCQPGVVAFLDLQVRGPVVDIAYMEVRQDKRGRGLARQLVQEAYDRHPDATIHWGKMMSPEIGTLYRSFKESHPEQTGSGSVYY